SADGGALELVRIEGPAQADEAAWRRFGLDASAPLAAAVREGSALFLASPAEIAARFPPAEGSSSEPPIAALAALPLALAGRAIGAVRSLRIARGSDEWLSAAAADELLLVAREATSSAVRDGGARAVDVRLSVAGRRSVLEIRAYGGGLDSSSRPDGLASLRRR